MKLGIIGAGGIVKNFFKYASHVSNLKVVAICATQSSEEKLKHICKEQNIDNYYLSVDELLKDEEVDTVYIAVPNHLHYEFTKKALHANKHVICEKPFTSNYQEAEELIKLAKEKNLILLDAVTTRYLPNMYKIKELISQIGQIKIASMNYSQYSKRYDSFKNGDILPAFDPNKSGGALMDLNIYNINLSVLLFGEPLKVDYQANIERGIDTSGILTLDYGTFKCVCFAAKDCKAPLLTTIQGDEGCIMIPSPANVLGGYQLLMNQDSSPIMSFQQENMLNHNGDKHKMYHEFSEFVRIIDEKDMEHVNKMQIITLITMDIVTKARKKAGIFFLADNKA